MRVEANGKRLTPTCGHQALHSARAQRLARAKGSPRAGAHRPLKCLVSLEDVRRAEIAGRRHQRTLRRLPQRLKLPLPHLVRARARVERPPIPPSCRPRKARQVRRPSALLNHPKSGTLVSKIYTAETNALPLRLGPPLRGCLLLLLRRPKRRPNVKLPSLLKASRLLIVPRPPQNIALRRRSGVARILLQNSHENGRVRSAPREHRRLRASGLRPLPGKQRGRCRRRSLRLLPYVII